MFALVVTGMLNKQIASQFGIGEKTVKVQRAWVIEKMRQGVGGRRVRLANRVGVITPRPLRRAPKVQVILDRRENDSRNPGLVNDQLHAHETLGIRIPG